MAIGKNWGKTLVKVSVYIEGGAPNCEKVDVATMTNSAVLRESIFKILKGVSGQEIDISLDLKGSRDSACKAFASVDDKSLSLFVDSDCPNSTLFSWFDQLKDNLGQPIIIPEEKKEKVFFMIQEMESWILKDVESLERCAEKEGWIRNDDSSIPSHSLIRNKDIEEIEKPSDKLALLLKHFFKDSKGKKIKYQKLKTAPSLLDCINPSLLKSRDSELQRFSYYVETL